MRKFRFLTPLEGVEEAAHVKSVRNWTIALALVMLAAAVLNPILNPAPKVKSYTCEIVHNADGSTTAKCHEDVEP